MGNRDSPAGTADDDTALEHRARPGRAKTVEQRAVTSLSDVAPLKEIWERDRGLTSYLLPLSKQVFIKHSEGKC